MYKSRAGRRANSVHGFDAYKSKSEQAQKSAGKGRRDTEGIHRRVECAD